MWDVWEGPGVRAKGSGRSERAQVQSQYAVGKERREAEDGDGGRGRLWPPRVRSLWGSSLQA